MQLAGAVLDVTDPEPLPAEHPLWVHPRVRIFPHRATVASEGVEDTVACCISLRNKALKGEPIDAVYELDWCAARAAGLAVQSEGRRAGAGRPETAPPLLRRVPRKLPQISNPSASSRREKGYCGEP